MDEPRVVALTGKPSTGEERAEESEVQVGLAHIARVRPAWDTAKQKQEKLMFLVD